jgi:glucokinase
MSKNKHKKTVLGIDIGGTKIAAGLVDYKGVVSNISKEKTPKTTPLLLKIIKNIIKDYSHFGEISNVGIGIPGQVNAKKGHILFCPNLTILNNVWLPQYLNETFSDLTFSIDNDVNCAALGQKHFGAGKDATSFLYLSIGTGIGGGLIINNEIHRGSTGLAGEVGHMVIDTESKVRCGCGQYGCIEALASGYAIAREAREAIERGEESIILSISDSKESISGKDVSEAVKLGDKAAGRIISKSGALIGNTISNIVNLLDMELVLLGGGIIAEGEPIVSSINEAALKGILKKANKDLRLQVIKDSKNAGILGAGALAIQNLTDW